MAVVDTLLEPEPRAFLQKQPGEAPTAADWPGPWFCRLFLAGWCGFLFFYGINTGQLWKTEGLRAIVAAGFVRSGNWIVPTLYGEPLFTKPPGMYAAIALCSIPLGHVTEWSARLPSAVSALLTVLMLYGYFSRVLGRRGGLLIAILAPMSPMWIDKATAAEIDMMQVMWVTGAILCLLRALEDEGGGLWNADCKLRIANCKLQIAGEGYQTIYRVPQPQFVWWLAALLCVAGGVLTKWTAPAFFYATAIPLLWWRGQMKLLIGWRHLAAVCIAAGLCLAWIAAAVAIAGWDIFYETVKREALQRILPDHAPSTDPWYVSLMHPFRLWYTNLPWSLVALWACRPSFGRLWDDRGRLLWQAMHCWVWPNIVIWSLMLDHKPRHSFPLFPGFAGLAALVWLAWFSAKLPWNWRVEPRRVLVAAVICWLIVKLAFVEVIVAQQRQHRDPRGKANVIAALIPSGAVLYLFRLKDEGIMFYYGRPAVRLRHPSELPSSGEPLYCILAREEWDAWRQASNRHTEVLTDDNLADEQGGKMVLIRVH